MSNIQFQLIELWETFLFQLDSDEDGPPFLPSALQAEQNQAAQAQAQAQSQAQQSETSTSADDTESRKNAPAHDDTDAEDFEANGAGVKAAGDDEAEGSLADSRLSEA